VSTARDEAVKASVANELLEQRDLAVSAQVLQEFYVQATQASRADRLSAKQAGQLVESFTRFRVEPTTVRLVINAIATGDRFRISYWDAAVIEAARSAGCDELLSEDLADGQDYAGVRVTNPFANL
jgi:predicted nucleic acid-binding protein